MRKITTLAAVALVIFASFLPLGAYAQSNLLPAQVSCPTYLTNLAVDLVNSSPTQVKAGDVVTTTFHVVYPDGTPVTLMPETASFVLIGAAGSKEFNAVSVAYTGNPGSYTYTQTITPDLAQATLGSSGAGKITVEVGGCGLSDALSNRGPTGAVASDETLSPSDDSHLNVGSTTQTPQAVNYIVPLLIALLIIVAILLFLLRSRRKSKK